MFSLSLSHTHTHTHTHLHARTHTHTHTHTHTQSANILLDRNCVGHIGDFGICKSAADTGGVTVTHMQTQNGVGTLL